MLLGLLAGIFAQSCAVMLPSTALEFEWFRDGRPYAHDVLIRTREGERLYRRRYENGSTAERVVSCTRVNRATYLMDRVGNAAPVRIPVELDTGSVRTVSGATVRHVAAPPGAASNMIWFTVASPGLRMYGMRRAAGITEIRTPVRGGYSVLRAVARNRADRAAADSQFSALAQRVEQLEAENRILRDSIRALLWRSADVDTAGMRRPSRDTLGPRRRPSADRDASGFRWPPAVRSSSGARRPPTAGDTSGIRGSPATRGPSGQRVLYPR